MKSLAKEVCQALTKKTPEWAKTYPSTSRWWSTNQLDTVCENCKEEFACHDMDRCPGGKTKFEVYE